MDCSSCGPRILMTALDVEGRHYWCSRCGELVFLDGVSGRKTTRVLTRPVGRPDADKRDLHGPRIGVRLWLAGQALASLAGQVCSPGDVAELSLRYADALLAAATGKKE